MPTMIDLEFEVGQRYRNRRGEYVVVSMEHPLMQIQYEDGDLQTVDINMQRRIYTNMVAETENAEAAVKLAEAKATAKSAKSTSKRAAAKVVSSAS